MIPEHEKKSTGNSGIVLVGNFFLLFLQIFESAFQEFSIIPGVKLGQSTLGKSLIFRGLFVLCINLISLLSNLISCPWLV